MYDTAEPGKADNNRDRAPRACILEDNVQSEAINVSVVVSKESCLSQHFVALEGSHELDIPDFNVSEKLPYH